jgi:hypothetical protein
MQLHKRRNEPALPRYQEIPCQGPEDKTKAPAAVQTYNAKLKFKAAVGSFPSMPQFITEKMTA